MLNFLLIVITLLLWLIYRYLTKEERLAKKAEKAYRKEQARQVHAEKEWLEEMQISEATKANNEEYHKEAELNKQIHQYQKTYKTWKWRK
jgi:ABC-type nickel/cobalt efflux system permease component RcnA